MTKGDPRTRSGCFKGDHLRVYKRHNNGVIVEFIEKEITLELQPYECEELLQALQNEEVYYRWW
jgi:hypothetical protein